ncbi:MAG: VCBS repeat-containing protein, partial [Akkermansiaceae bacterium]|nr:VCBS repeat-containing protein [Akkermansiaceae bacterium]
FTNGVSRSFNNSDDQRSMEDYIGQTEWDYYESHPPRKEENLAFANLGGLRFANVSAKWGLDHRGMSYSAATGDLDGDGDQELIVASLEEPVRIYRNDAPASRNRITVRMSGAAANPGGMGATVWVESGGRLQKRTLRPATGFLSSNAPELVFGLGQSTKIDALTVKWQRGHIQRLENLQAGQTITIREPSGPPPAWKKPARPPQLFASIASPSLQAIAHREEEFDDYARQPLLPYKHSQLGPGTAWADVDSDGDPDVFLAGASGSPGRVFRNEGRGRFSDLP